jgi:hypothetical protein
VSLRLRGVYLGDPVILLLSATLAGLIVFLVAGKPWIALAQGTLPRSDEFKYMTGFREGELAFIAVRIVGLNIIESFLLIGVITAVAGAYIVGMGRDQGYSALSTLLNIGRRTYIRALTLYPLILYQTSIVPGLLIAMALIDINLLKYWKLLIASTLIILAVVQIQLTITMITTYILGNTYRGIIAATAILLLLTTTLGLHKNLANIIGKEAIDEVLVAAAITVLVTSIILTIAYLIIESRMTTR